MKIHAKIGTDEFDGDGQPCDVMLAYLQWLNTRENELRDKLMLGGTVKRTYIGGIPDAELPAPEKTT